MEVSTQPVQETEDYAASGAGQGKSHSACIKRRFLGSDTLSQLLSLGLQGSARSICGRAKREAFRDCWKPAWRITVACHGCPSPASRWENLVSRRSDSAEKGFYWHCNCLSPHIHRQHAAESESTGRTGRCVDTAVESGSHARRHCHSCASSIPISITTTNFLAGSDCTWPL